MVSFKRIVELCVTLASKRPIVVLSERKIFELCLTSVSKGSYLGL